MFVWKVSKGKRKRGSIAGSLTDGYRGITVDRQNYVAHRLAWFYVHGRWPKAQVYFINGRRDDNRIANLQDQPRRESKRRPNCNPSPKPLPPAKYLRACLDYDRSSGVLTWKTRPRNHFATEQTWVMVNTKYASKRADLIHPLGHRVVRINNVLYGEHRVIWKLVTGDEPPRGVKRVNDDLTDNSWANLRDFSPPKRGRQKAGSNR